MAQTARCPFYMDMAPKPPAQLNLKVLHPVTNFSEQNYAEAFKTLDLPAVKQDLVTLMTDSKEWWPADYGHYGPLMIRLAWHSAGTYRTSDGRGGANSGNMRFAPLNSWPDNGNLDKARRLLWPVKKKYGNKLSWGDLMILAGNVALEDMGFETFGFAGGRVDIWEKEEDIYWGPEDTMLADERHHEGQLETPLGASQMGLIYVNPEGPGGNPDPQAAADAIRVTFGRMAMNDEESVALIAGGHTFGKAHGAAPGSHQGPAPEGGKIEDQGFGWNSDHGSGKGVDTITSGLEGAWTAEPTKWDNGYFENLFKYEWEKTTSPGGATQWKPTDPAADGLVPDAHDANQRHPPMMFTTDLALRTDPSYLEISKRFREHPDQFKDAFARAWYKLTHRDMGPISRCLGPEVAPEQLWQDPVPKHEGGLVSDAEIAELKQLASKAAPGPQLIRTAWAAAACFRVTDFRGGANGARLRLAPQKDWEVNNPAELAEVLAKLEQLQAEFNGSHQNKISLADMIVLAGSAAVEAAAAKAGQSVSVPVRPGRTDASQEQTDVESFGVLEPSSDGFRNFNATMHQLVDRAQLLGLSATEMTVLVGGLRVLNANHSESPLGVFTNNPEALTNDFFANLFDMSVSWERSAACEHLFEGKCMQSGEVKWRGTEVDLMFGSNAELRAIGEYYACDDAQEKFVNDFVAAWCKVMDNDRFEL